MAFERHRFLHFAPLPVIGGVTTLLLLLAIATTFTASNIPRSQMLLAPEAESIRLLTEDGTAVQLRAIGNRQGEEIALLPSDLLEEPDLLATYEQYNTFLDRQQNLYDLLNSNQSLQLYSATQSFETAVLEPSLATLPLAFWIQLAVALISGMIGIGVWSFRHGNHAAMHFGISGVPMAMAILPAAIYSSRWLAMDGELFRILSIIDHAGLYLLCAALVSLTWSYPMPLTSRPFPLAAYSSMLCIWIFDTLQWLPNLDISTRIIPIFVLCISIALLAMHFRRTRNNPSQRVSVNWFLLLVVGGSGLFVTLVFLPPLFGRAPLISQAYAFVAFLIIYLGMAAGISRSRIFDLNTWWFHAWLWILGGIIFITFDIVFSLLLSLNPTQSLWMALAVAGWLYFPIRQWLMKRLLLRSSGSIEQHLPDLVSIVAGSRTPDEAFEGWKQFMLQTYQPLNHETVDGNETEDGITADALTMTIRSPDQNKAIRLRYAHRGRHIFTRYDLEAAIAIRDLFAQALQAINIRDSATEAERNRIRQDIHDTLGGTLLSILHHSQQQEIRDLAQSAWREMREILAALDNRPKAIDAAIQRWRQSLDRQTHSAHVELVWRLSPALNRLKPMPANTVLQIGRIIQEAVTNAIRHASPSEITLAIDVEAEHLQIVILHDGNFGKPETWVEGRGLTHMQQRTSSLRGSISRSTTDRELCTTIAVPLTGVET